MKNEPVTLDACTVSNTENGEHDASLSKFQVEEHGPTSPAECEQMPRVHARPTEAGALSYQLPVCVKEQPDVALVTKPALRPRSLHHGASGWARVNCFAQRLQKQFERPRGEGVAQKEVRGAKL